MYGMGRKKRKESFKVRDEEVVGAMTTLYGVYRQEDVREEDDDAIQKREEASRYT